MQPSAAFSSFSVRSARLQPLARQFTNHRPAQLTHFSVESAMSTSNEDTNAELQKRYEEAMRRRQMRRVQKEGEQTKDLFEVQVTESIERAGGAKRKQSKAVKPKKSKPRTDVTEMVLHAQTLSQHQDISRSIKDEVSGGDQRSTSPKSEEVDTPTGKSRFQVYETYFEEDYYDTDSYDEYTSSHRNKPSCQWETYRSSSVLFPPPSKSDRPKAIIHFVGGTFFGSYPRRFYGKFLEDIAAKCDAVVVATPIPLILPGKGLVDRLGNWLFDDSLEDDLDMPRKRRDERLSTVNNNPLDHLHLARVVQKEFNNAYRDVIIDEYCHDFNSEEQVEEFMTNVPIVGIGHSLGARIQAVSCSHPDIVRYLAMGKGGSLIRSGREGMIYLGFANWGASASIPGVESLEQVVRTRERSARLEDQYRRGTGSREDVYGGRRRRRGFNDDLRRRYGQDYDRYSQYDVEDLDLADVFGVIFSGVAKGAKQIGNALTPDVKDLEFKPSPDELWDGLSSSSDGYSSSCQNTLIVQFDEDPIDQGSRLARTLLNVSNKTDSLKNEPSTSLHDVKFARLKGGHLTPVSFRDGIAKILPSKALAVLTSSSDYLVQQLGDETSKSSRRQQKELADVVDTVASYIREAL